MGANSGSLAPAPLPSPAPGSFGAVLAPVSQFPDFRGKDSEKAKKNLVSWHWEPQEPAPLLVFQLLAPGFCESSKVVKELLGAGSGSCSSLGAAPLPLLALWLRAPLPPLALWLRLHSQILGASSQLPTPEMVGSPSLPIANLIAAGMFAVVN